MGSAFTIAPLNAVDAAPEFTYGKDAQENLALDRLRKPTCQMRVASLALSQFRDDVCVDQVAQREAFLPLSC